MALVRPKILFGLLWAAFASFAQAAEVFRSVGPDGTVQFSDERVEGAEPVRLETPEPATGSPAGTASTTAATLEVAEALAQDRRERGAERREALRLRAELAESRARQAEAQARQAAAERIDQDRFLGPGFGFPLRPGHRPVIEPIPPADAPPPPEPPRGSPLPSD
jgi:hypothetical protein